MSTRWLKLTIAYDGGAYAGWQIQPDRSTVQGTFEATWQRLTQESLRVTAAGRTDAGVHAIGQVIGLATETRLSNQDVQRALNALLPDDIKVLIVDDAREGFHATRDALGKTYEYRIDNCAYWPDVFARHYAWHYPQPLDAAAMQAAGQALVGRHDFSSFETAGSERPDSVRTIRDLNIIRGTCEREDHIAIRVSGDGFLYNMVRTIVGTLVKVGSGKRDIGWPADVLAACDRRKAGQTAPPHGLFLVRVDY